MKNLRKYIRQILIETTDPEFLRSVEEIWEDWQDVQKNIPTEEVTEPEYGYFWDEEKQDHDQKWKDITRKVQVTKDEEKPGYAKENPAYYDQRHSAERRVRYGQTKKEIDVEKKIMRLWQEHADLDFFRSDKMTYTHDVVYKSAARGMGSSGVKISAPSKNQWIKAQSTPQKNAISVSAAYSPDGDVKVGSQMMMGKGWGFLIKGWPIFAAFTDLASQTQRMASDKAREYHKSSGLPKRAGMPSAATRKWTDRDKRFRSRSLKRKGKTQDEIDDWFKIRANSVALNEKDIKERGDKGLEEVIIDNWTISAWYISDIYQARRFFIKALATDKITKPVYLLDRAWSGDESQQKFDPSNRRDVERLLKILNTKRQ